MVSLPIVCHLIQGAAAPWLGDGLALWCSGDQKSKTSRFYLGDTRPNTDLRQVSYVISPQPEMKEASICQFRMGTRGNKEGWTAKRYMGTVCSKETGNIWNGIVD